jgi:hypothetical protein
LVLFLYIRILLQFSLERQCVPSTHQQLSMEWTKGGFSPPFRSNEHRYKGLRSLAIVSKNTLELLPTHFLFKSFKKTKQWMEMFLKSWVYFKVNFTNSVPAVNYASLIKFETFKFLGRFTRQRKFPIWPTSLCMYIFT